MTVRFRRNEIGVSGLCTLLDATVMIRTLLSLRCALTRDAGALDLLELANAVALRL